MTLLQGAIGTVNDLADAPADAVAKPWKPIPAGLVAPRAARAIAVALVVVGLVLTVPSGPGVMSVAAAGVATGLLYDLRFKGTGASWVPFAIGIPLLPLYGALGAAAAGAVVPVSIAALCLLAVPGGAGLAIANAVADADADGASGTGSVAATLGRGRAWVVGACLTAGTGLAAAAGVMGAPSSVSGPSLAAAVIAGLGLLIVGAGLALARPRRGASADPRRAGRGWELQGIGLGLLAVAWVIALPLG